MRASSGTGRGAACPSPCNRVSPGCAALHRAGPGRAAGETEVGDFRLEAQESGATAAKLRSSALSAAPAGSSSSFAAGRPSPVVNPLPGFRSRCRMPRSCGVLHRFGPGPGSAPRHSAAARGRIRPVFGSRRSGIPERGRADLRISPDRKDLHDARVLQACYRLGLGAERGEVRAGRPVRQPGSS